MNITAAPHRCLKWGCSASFARREDLNRHKASCDGGPRPARETGEGGGDTEAHPGVPRRFTCTECGNSYVWLLDYYADVDRHERTRQATRRRAQRAEQEANHGSED